MSPLAGLDAHAQRLAGSSIAGAARAAALSLASLRRDTLAET